MDIDNLYVSDLGTPPSFNQRNNLFFGINLRMSNQSNKEIKFHEVNGDTTVFFDSDGDKSDTFASYQTGCWLLTGT